MQLESINVRVSTRARQLRITVKPGGEVLLTVPRWVPQFVAQQFLWRKSAWIARAVEKMKQVPTQVARRRGTQREFRARKNEALRFVQQRIAHFNKVYHFPFNRITIRNQKTRWGSCSARGNLSFNYRILNLSPDIADYLVVHELCHLAQPNHSTRFWALVSRTIANFRTLRKALRTGL